MVKGQQFTIHVMGNDDGERMMGKDDGHIWVMDGKGW